MHELMAARIAAELHDGDVVVLGSFTPLAYGAYMLAKLTTAQEMFLVGYSAIGTSAVALSFSATESALYRGAVGRWGFVTEVNAIHLANRGSAECVSSAQLDGTGAINLSVIGSYDSPKVRLPGGAGAPEVIRLYRTMIAYYGDHSPRTLVPRVDFVTGARRPVGRAAREANGLLPGPIIVVTNLAVLRKAEDDQPFRLESVHPGVEVDFVVAQTGFDLDVPVSVPTTAPPSLDQLHLLRDRIDPFDTMRFDILPARERLAYLRDVLSAEWSRPRAGDLVNRPTSVQSSPIRWESLSDQPE
ncbi:MAG: CoA-transferase [Ilumatobacteraceae bacterium]